MRFRRFWLSWTVLPTMLRGKRMSDDAGSYARLLLDVSAASGAAMVAGYARRKQASRWSVDGIAAMVAEAVACGLLAVFIASVMDWADRRAYVGLAAALALIGTNALSDLALSLAKRKVDKQ